MASKLLPLPATLLAAHQALFSGTRSHLRKKWRPNVTMVDIALLDARTRDPMSAPAQLVG